MAAQKLVQWLAGLAAVVIGMTAAQAEPRTVHFYNWSNYVALGVLDDFT